MHPHQALLLYSIFLILDQKGSATTSEVYLNFKKRFSAAARAKEISHVKAL